MYFFTGRNEVSAKVIFLHLSVILFTGGGSGKETPPRLDGGTTTPPRDWEPPPRLDGDTPQLDGGTPPGWMESPPPGWMEEPPGWMETPPPQEADSCIRSTIGRYASYWNAFLWFYWLSGSVEDSKFTIRSASTRHENRYVWRKSALWTFSEVLISATVNIFGFVCEWSALILIGILRKLNCEAILEIG